MVVIYYWDQVKSKRAHYARHALTHSCVSSLQDSTDVALIVNYSLASSTSFLACLAHKFDVLTFPTSSLHFLCFFLSGHPLALQGASFLETLPNEALLSLCGWQQCHHSPFCWINACGHLTSTVHAKDHACRILFECWIQKLHTAGLASITRPGLLAS